MIEKLTQHQCRAIIAIAINNKELSDGVEVSNNELASEYMHIVCYDGLLWQVIIRHDIIEDSLSYKVSFVEGVFNEPQYQELDSNDKMILVELDPENYDEDGNYIGEDSEQDDGEFNG
jgi:hypothetical protein